MWSLVVVVFNFVFLGCMWWIGDLEFIPKLVISVLFALSLALAFVPVDFLFIGVQCVMFIVLGFSAFGIDFLRGGR
jgi:hypothetical protein